MAAIVTSPMQVLAVLCLSALGIKGHLGECPNVKGSDDFRLKDYLGVWYEAQVHWTLLDIMAKCPATTYSLLKNGDIGIKKHYTNRLYMPRTVHGVAEVDRNKPYRLHWKIPKVVPLSLFYTDVLYTDYTDYAIVYNCRNIMLLLHDDFLWLMTRKRVASDKTIRAARKKIRELGLDTSKLTDIDQSNCEDLTPRLSTPRLSRNTVTNTHITVTTKSRSEPVTDIEIYDFQRDRW